MEVILVTPKETRVGNLYGTDGIKTSIYWPNYA